MFSVASRYEDEQNRHLDWVYLSNPKEMDPQRLAKEDILILDIQMGSINGIELAREIRKLNENNIIIFTTNYLEYALQGYEVAAFRYLKKPIDYSRNLKYMLLMSSKRIPSPHSRSYFCTSLTILNQYILN